MTESFTILAQKNFVSSWFFQMWNRIFLRNYTWRSRFFALAGMIAISVFCFLPTSINAQSEPEKDILETAIETKGLRVLVALLKTADLDETLQGDGPFTVFAPTDTAFTKISLPKIRELRNDPEGKLTDLLLAHSAADRITAVDIVDLIDGNLNSLNSLPLVFTEENGIVFVNGAAIRSTDIEASNGVIHIIDSVIMPSTLQGTRVSAASTIDTSDESQNEGIVNNDDTGSTNGANADGNSDAATNEATNEATSTDADAATVPVENVADPNLPPDLLGTVTSLGNFTTLLTAIDSADLVETLQGEGPFTIFAPVDSALAALPAGSIQKLLDAPQEELAAQLLLHVVPGELLATDIVNLANSDVETANGKLLPIRVNEVGLTVGGAVMMATNIQTRNGVIHIVDNIFIESTRTATDTIEASAEASAPTSVSEPVAAPIVKSVAAPALLSHTADLVDTAIAAGNFNTLVAALKTSGLDETLNTGGSFTIFAPTDQAFAALPRGTVDAMLADPSGSLTDLLLYHTVEGLLPIDYITSIDGSALKSVGGDLLTINVNSSSNVLISGATLMATDIVATNGLIHVIDRVLLNPDSSAAESESSDPDPEIAPSSSALDPIATPTPAETAPPVSEDTNCLLFYVIKRGDTLYEIADLYGTTTKVLLEMNNLTDPDDIKYGQNLCVSQ